MNAPLRMPPTETKAERLTRLALEVTGTRSWLVARLDCGACGARFTPTEFEVALEIALSGVKSPAGGGA